MLKYATYLVCFLLLPITALAVHLPKENKITPLELAGEKALKDKNWDKAVKIFRILVDEHPLEADVWYKYGGALGMKALSVSKWESIRYLSDMKSAFEKSIELDKAHIGAYWALIHYHCEVPGILGGSNKKARTYARHLMQLSQADGLLALGFLAQHENKILLSEKLFEEAKSFMKKTEYNNELLSVYQRISYKQKIDFITFVEHINTYRPREVNAFLETQPWAKP